MLRIGKTMTPQDDQLAALLSEMGFSFRRIAEMMAVTDKTAKAAAVRGVSGPDKMTVRTRSAFRALLEFFKWMDLGKSRGYLKLLAAHFGRREDPDG